MIEIDKLAALADAHCALIDIATKHQSYEGQAPTEYGRGVVDGHRCAAKIAREYLRKYGIDDWEKVAR